MREIGSESLRNLSLEAGSEAYAIENGDAGRPVINRRFVGYYNIADIEAILRDMRIVQDAFDKGTASADYVF
jgi:hypothetical protein